MSIYRIKSTPSWDGQVLAYSTSEAKQRVAKRVAKAMRIWLEEHGNMATALDHRLVLRPFGYLGGLVLEETCDAPPCPWFGQPRGATEKLTREVIKVWYEDVDVVVVAP